MSTKVCVLESIDSEKRIVRRLQAGEEEAFRELLTCCGRRFFNYAYRLTWDEEDAKDLFQETLLRLVRGIRNFRGEARLLTWLFRISSNQFIKSKRRKTGEPDRSRVRYMEEISEYGSNGRAYQLPDDSSDPFDRVLAEERRSLLWQAIESLPTEERIVLFLRDIEGLSAAETAKTLGLSIPAVKSRLHRARLEIREELARVSFSLDET